MNQDQKNNSSIQDAIMEDHSYDGIQEFNNPAPFWWQLFFYLSIAFGIGYYTYYELLDGPSSSQELARDLGLIKEKIKKSEGQGPNEEVLLAAFNSEDKKKLGSKVYAEKCASCHQPDGGGMIGPNLTDDFWIHGQGKLMDIYNVVKNGVLDKGMPPWGAILSSDELIDVVGFIKSIRGQKVAHAKEPQGEKVDE